jgi:osmotically-inducible protein OsmY
MEIKVMRNLLPMSAVVLASTLTIANIGFAQAPAATPVSADQIEEAIEQRWQNDATLKACQNCDLDVEATGDVVRISGTVPTAALRARAARLANVRGVSRVDDQIAIGTPRSAEDAARSGANKAANKTAEGVSKAAEKTGEAASKTGAVIDDAWITTKVKSKFVTDDAVEGSQIDVDTKHNIVTLTGTVPTSAAHAAALRIARETKGVKQVVDNLKVAPKTN